METLQEQVNKIVNSNKTNLEKFLKLKKLYKQDKKVFEKLNFTLFHETGLDKWIAFSPEVKESLNKKMKTYVVKYGVKYCAFESYGAFRLVDVPIKASLFSNLIYAKKRLTDDLYYQGTKVHGFTLVEIEWKALNEKVLEKSEVSNEMEDYGLHS